MKHSIFLLSILALTGIFSVAISDDFGDRKIDQSITEEDTFPREVMIQRNKVSEFLKESMLSSWTDENGLHLSYSNTPKAFETASNFISLEKRCSPVLECQIVSSSPDSFELVLDGPNEFMEIVQQGQYALSNEQALFLSSK